MATIGFGTPFQPQGVYSGPSFANVGGPQAPMSFTGGPGGLDYNLRLMAELESIINMMSMLENGATAPCGNANNGPQPTSLAGAGSKGGRALAKTGAKALAKAGGKGQTLKKAAAKSR